MQDATNHCDKIKELLSAYRDLELTDEENAQVERHLGTCHECAREASAIETVAATLSQVPRVTMKVDMADRLEAFIAAQAAESHRSETKVEEKEQKVVSIKKRLVWGSLAAAAAAAVLLVAVPFFTSSNRVASNDVKQVAPLQEEVSQQPLVANDHAVPTTGADESTAPAPDAVASSGGAHEIHKVEKPEIAHNDTPVAAPVVVKKQASPKVAHRQKVDATLDSIGDTEALVAFSADDNMFEDCGISTDEDGLYAIKL